MPKTASPGSLLFSSVLNVLSFPQLIDVAMKLGPALQVGEKLVWEGKEADQSSRGSKPQPQGSVASSSSSFQEDGSFV